MFSRYNQIERKLLDLYTQMGIPEGLSPSEAKKRAKVMLDNAIEQSKREGTYNKPDNFGDIILGHADTKDPHFSKLAEIIRGNMPKKIEESVTEKDIHFWWNLNDIERRMMELEDDRNRLASFMIRRLEMGDTEEEASQSVRKYFPMYGDPSDTRITTGDDRPLPFELKARVNDYTEDRIAKDPDQFRTEIEQSTTLNALIRKEIRAGRL